MVDILNERVVANNVVANNIAPASACSHGSKAPFHRMFYTKAGAFVFGSGLAIVPFLMAVSSKNSSG